ncbi:lysine transporter LysE [Corynebacterium yudongzhengii]|uniref:LysE family translocator n=1 Tax=Corynebacterium yudongzhengii TaxID=2080740 RepID=A0A2U1T911_9CORY|nr:LysE family translocator [Corynebacterium yudongzhengii]AWB82441.1 lysine transporter LysE [Corynebacterium yudongzhengii]PWC02504.1 LysE family translocator [Corynebacterium yudongzhengii]
MSVGNLLLLAALNVVGALSPGPDIILITRTATRSRRHAVAVTAGIQTGVVFWCALTVLGAAALLTAFPEALEIVQLVGGGWLIYMGIRMLIGGWKDRTTRPVDLDEAEARLGRLRQAYLSGLATNLSNPKIVLFLSAMIAPLLPPQPTVWQAVVVVLVLSLSALAVQLSLALVVSTNAVRRRLLRAGPFIDIGAGLFFVVAGVTLAFNGAHGLLT